MNPQPSVVSSHAVLLLFSQILISVFVIFDFVIDSYHFSGVEAVIGMMDTSQPKPEAVGMVVYHKR